MPDRHPHPQRRRYDLLATAARTPGGVLVNSLPLRRQAVALYRLKLAQLRVRPDQPIHVRPLGGTKEDAP